MANEPRARPLGAGLQGLALLLATGACAPGTADLPEPLTLAEEDGSHPTVAVDAASGTAYVAWVGSRSGGEEWNVYLARLEEEGRLEGPVRVNEEPGDAAPHEQAPAQVRVAPDGAVYVVWQTSRHIPGRHFPASDLRFARSNDGGRTFGPTLSVNDNAGQDPASHTFHDLAVGPDGTIYVSWIDGRRRGREEARRTGEEVSVEEGDPLPDLEIRIARSEDGGRSFGPSTVVDENPCPCCRTALAVGQDGQVHLAWRKVYEGDIRDIVVARSNDGGKSFTAPVRVAEDDWSIAGCPHAGPSLALDGSGRLHVAWYTGKTDEPGVYHTVSLAGAEGFSPPTPLLTDDWVPPARVALASGPRGEVWAAWEDGRREPGWIDVARINVGSSPSPVAELRERRPGRYPALVLGEQGPVLAWLEGEGVRLRPAR